MNTKPLDVSWLWVYDEPGYYLGWPFLKLKINRKTFWKNNKEIAAWSMLQIVKDFQKSMHSLKKSLSPRNNSKVSNDGNWHRTQWTWFMALRNSLQIFKSQIYRAQNCVIQYILQPQSCVQLFDLFRRISMVFIPAGITVW